MVGMVLLGRKVITLYLNYKAAVEQPMSRPVIWDSSDPGGTNNKPVGPVVGYDQFSSPLVLYRDARSTPAFSPNFKPGILLGVRPNRFTTTSKVYYLGSNCSDAFGVAIKTSSIPPSPWPNVGFLSQLQGMNYAVGNGNILYREGSGVGSVGANIPIHSVWSWTTSATRVRPPAVPRANLGGATLLLAAAADDGNTQALVTAFTTTSHFLNNGDTVTIGGVNEAGFNIMAVITRISATSFTYVKPLPQNPGLVYNATFSSPAQRR